MHQTADREHKRLAGEDIVEHLAYISLRSRWRPKHYYCFKVFQTYMLMSLCIRYGSHTISGVFKYMYKSNTSFLQAKPLVKSSIFSMHISACLSFARWPSLTASIPVHSVLAESHETARTSQYSWVLIVADDTIKSLASLPLPYPVILLDRQHCPSDEWAKCLLIAMDFKLHFYLMGMWTVMIIQWYYGEKHFFIEQRNTGILFPLFPILKVYILWYIIKLVYFMFSNRFFWVMFWWVHQREMTQ